MADRTACKSSLFISKASSFPCDARNAATFEMILSNCSDEHMSIFVMVMNKGTLNAMAIKKCYQSSCYVLCLMHLVNMVTSFVISDKLSLRDEMIKHE